MAKAPEAKKPFQVRLPADVLAYLSRRYHETGVEKQLQALAGLVALEACGPSVRSSMIQVATRVATGEVAWAEVVKLLGDRKPTPREQKELLDLIGPYLARLGTSPGARRRAQ